MPLCEQCCALAHDLIKLTLAPAFIKTGSVLIIAATVIASYDVVIFMMILRLDSSNCLAMVRSALKLLG